MTNESLREYLDRKSNSSATYTLSTFNSLVQKKLKVDMNDPSSSSRMKRLIIDYYTIVRESGCCVVLEGCQNLAVSHVLSAIKPQSLQTRLGDDLQFSKYALRKDFRGFTKHAIAVATAYELIDNGANKKSFKPSPAKTKIPEEDDDQVTIPRLGKKTKILPACPMPACMKKGLKHWLSECEEDPEEIEKMRR